MRFAIAFAAAAFSTAVFAGPMAERNGILTDADGRTLYTFDKDAGGKSACNGGCATAWPPLLAKEGAAASGDFGLIKRDDGAMQWTYKARPVYRYVGDAKAGDKLGDGQGGVWHAVPVGAAGRAAPAVTPGYGNYGY